MPSGAVLIPVKDFAQAKSRLGPALEPRDRARLAEAIATHVVQAQRTASVAICCDDPGVAEWAEGIGAQVIWCPGTDLNGAVTRGYDELGAQGIDSVAIAHGDLPLAGDLSPLLGWPGVTIVPDRHRTGTNVMALPTGLDFEFGYGVGSFRHHLRHAVVLQRGIRIVHDRNLGWDIDDPDDLADADDIIRRLLERKPR